MPSTPQPPRPAPPPASTKTRSKRPGNEEPEITQEEAVPSDGKDKKGEQMMEELGRERRQQDKDRS
jgi:hypothetical protein